MCSSLGGPYYPVGPTLTCHHPPPPPASPGGLFVTRGAVCYIVSAGACYIVSVWNVQADFLLPALSFPLTFHPQHPQSVLLSPPILTAVCLWGGQLSPGSFSSSWDLPNGGEGWLQSGIARQLALVRGVVARICTPRTLSGGFVLIRRSFYFLCVVIGALLELSLLSLYTAAYRGIISTGGVLVLHPGAADGGGGGIMGSVMLPPPPRVYFCQCKC